ncbi:MAG: hypothetical protein CM1200mP24_00610 [Gammaproteobacteria bacterium]|nr:MAG: hypothetical protein CM1200mP24_00610 [Gammaproteobacteria bacterium]
MGSIYSQVFPGDSLDSTATVTAIHDGLVDLEVSTVNQKGVEVAKGSATARLDWGISLKKNPEIIGVFHVLTKTLFAGLSRHPPLHGW